MINVIFEKKISFLNVTKVRNIINQTIKAANKSIKADINIIFTDSKTIQKYNKTYRNTNSPTDVISLEDSEDKLHEILICPEIVRANSKTFKTSYSEEMQRVIIHGTLHVLGFDHKDSLNPSESMFSLQEKILSDILSK